MREFITYKFEWSHGSKPRGVGSYAFIPEQGYYPDENVPDDGIAWAWGTYTEAKREVVKRFPKVDRWVVLP